MLLWRVGSSCWVKEGRSKKDFGFVKCRTSGSDFRNCAIWYRNMADGRSSRLLHVLRGRFIEIWEPFLQRIPQVQGGAFSPHPLPAVLHPCEDDQRSFERSKDSMQTMHSMPSTSYSSRPALGANLLHRCPEKRNVAAYASTPLPSKVTDYLSQRTYSSDGSYWLQCILILVPWY